MGTLITLCERGGTSIVINLDDVSWKDQKFILRYYLLVLKGQLNSERIYEVIVSPKMPTNDFQDFCPTKQTKIVALLGGFFGECR